MAIEISSSAPRAATPRAPSLRLDLRLGSRKVGARDRMFFSDRLSLLLETGVALYPALVALRGQSPNPELGKVLDDLAETVQGGKSFSEALAHHPAVFPTTYVNLVAAGEKGGFLHDILRQLLMMDEKREKVRSTLSSALSYPVFLVVFSAAVVVFMLIVVFPKFTTLFGAIRDQLPVTTIALMAMSDVLRQYWIAVAAGLGAGAIAVAQWWKRPAARDWVDRLKLRVPLLRGVFIQLYLINTLRVLSLSMANGVGLLDALESCRDLVRNGVFQRFIERLETLVTEGRGLSAGFREAEFVPAIVRQMIDTGEETGNLPLVMGRVAEFYERELEKRVTTLSKMAEPVMLLVMGLLVGVIVSSLILPIFKLSKAVG